MSHLKKCSLDKKHEDYFVWTKIKVMDETTTCKVFPNKNKELHQRVFKKFNSVLKSTNKKRGE